MKKAYAPASGPTLCKKVRGCAHPPNHQGPCEIDAIPPIPKGRGAVVELTHVDSFLDQQERVTRDAGRIADELLIIIGANTVMFEGGLTREALVLLVTAKCKRAKNGSRLSEDTVAIVLDAIEHLGEFIAGAK